MAKATVSEELAAWGTEVLAKIEDQLGAEAMARPYPRELRVESMKETARVNGCIFDLRAAQTKVNLARRDGITAKQEAALAGFVKALRAALARDEALALRAQNPSAT